MEILKRIKEWSEENGGFCYALSPRCLNIQISGQKQSMIEAHMVEILHSEGSM